MRDIVEAHEAHIHYETTDLASAQSTNPGLLPCATPTLLKAHSLFFIHRPLLLLQLRSQIPILRLELLNLELESSHLLLGTNAELLNNLKEAPEAQDDDQRGHFLEHAVEENVCDEACQNDNGIEDVESGVEVSLWEVSVLVSRVVPNVVG